MNYFIELHNSIFKLFYGLTEYSPEFNIWVYIIAERLDWYVIFAGILFIILHRHGYRINRPVLISRVSLLEGIYTISGILLAWLISYLMKIGFAIARPFIQLDDVVPLFLYGGYDSFPSGHATLFAALAVAIYMHHRRVGALFVFCAFIIGTARIIAGVHFPFDVFIGWLIGGLVSYSVYRLFTHRMR